MGRATGAPRAAPSPVAGGGGGGGGGSGGGGGGGGGLGLGGSGVSPGAGEGLAQGGVAQWGDAQVAVAVYDWATLQDTGPDGGMAYYQAEALLRCAALGEAASFEAEI